MADDAPLTPDQMVSYYIQMRDHVAETKKRHQVELDPYMQAMTKIENMLLDFMNTHGLDSVKTPHGTPYKQTHVSVSVADWPTFYGWTVNTGNEGMLTRGAAKSAVQAFMKETETVPPGLNVSSVVVCNIRRSDDK